jgi:hypothetical protein
MHAVSDREQYSRMPPVQCKEAVLYQDAASSQSDRTAVVHHMLKRLTSAVGHLRPSWRASSTKLARPVCNHVPLLINLLFLPSNDCAVACLILPVIASCLVNARVRHLVGPAQLETSAVTTTTLFGSCEICSPCTTLNSWMHRLSRAVRTPATTLQIDLDCVVRLPAFLQQCLRLASEAPRLKQVQRSAMLTTGELRCR